MAKRLSRVARGGGLLAASAFGVLSAPGAVLAQSQPQSPAAAQLEPAAPGGEVTAETAAGASAAVGEQAQRLEEGAVVSDIVVTAQRREESLQKVPLTVQAFSSENLAATGIQTTADLPAVTPGLVLARGIGLSSPFLRGVGSSSNGPGVENSVATYVDGIYLGSKSAALSQLIDVERVEVLKGPQGTLFGRNATGGLIQIVTRDPAVDPGLRLTLDASNYETAVVSSYVNGGIADGLSAGLSLTNRYQGAGWGRNVVTGRDVNVTNFFSTRGKVKYEASEDLTFTVAGDYTFYESDVGAATRVLEGARAVNGYVYEGPRYGVADDVDQFLRSRIGGVSLTATHDGHSSTLTSITAYREARYRVALDSDVTPARNLRFDSTVNERQFSQELQLSGGSRTGLQYSLGGYLFIADGRSVNGLSGALFPTLTSSQTIGEQRTRSGAAYVQATYALAESTRLTAGLRYTVEKRELLGFNRRIALDGSTAIPFVVPRGTETTFRRPTWRIALDHDLAPDVLGYMSYNRGFRSGGFNPGLLTNPPVKPEILDAYEVGLKSSLLDQRLRLNVSGFYYSFSDIQLSQFALGIQTIRNAAKAELYGLDLDFEVVPITRLRFSGGLEYLQGTYRSFPGAAFAVPLPGGGNQLIIGDASGKDVIRTPRLTGNVALNYTVPVGPSELVFNVNYAYNDGFFTEPDNLLRQRAYSLINGQIGLEMEDGRQRVVLWARNLTNRYYTTILTAASVASISSPGEPRTFGVRWEGRF